MGPLSEHDYHDVLSCSDVHFYLSVPFVLSWSLLEAMAVGLPIVSCNTPPVLEVLSHNENALLSDFFDIDAHVSNICSFLDDPSLSKSLGDSAQGSASRYSCETGFEQWSVILP